MQAARSTPGPIANDADAFQRFYRLIADAMLEGAATELFSPPGATT